MFSFLIDPIVSAVLWGAVILIVVIVVVVLLRSIKVAKPDEAIIVTSRQKPLKTGSDQQTENAGQRVVFGSRVFVKPIVEAFFKLSLRSRQLNVQATAQTKDAITIRVNAVAPAVVKTRFATALYEGREDEVSANYPLKRLGVPEDIGSVVAFLLSDDAGWMTGQTLTIDGGVLLGGGV